MLLSYTNADILKKLRVYCKPLDLKYYFLKHVRKAAYVPGLAIGEQRLYPEEQWQ
jgi:hypothetical protein